MDEFKSLLSSLRVPFLRRAVQVVHVSLHSKFITVVYETRQTRLCISTTAISFPRDVLMVMSWCAAHAGLLKRAAHDNPDDIESTESFFREAIQA